MEQRAVDPRADSDPHAAAGGAGGPELDPAEEALLEALLQDDGEQIDALERTLGEGSGAPHSAAEDEPPAAGDAGAAPEREEAHAVPEPEAADEPEGDELDDEAEPDAPEGEPAPALDRGTPPEAEAGAPAGMPEEVFAAYVESAAALLFASPEPLSVGRLLELLTAGEKHAEAEAAEAEADSEVAGPPNEAGDARGDAPSAAAGEQNEGAEVAPGEAEARPAPAAQRVKLGRAGVQRVLAELSLRFERAALPIVVREIAGGWRLFTDERLGEVVTRLDRSRRVERISQAALETLSIIAYRQPVTKAEIEAIRGVQAGPVLRQLVDRRLAKVTGRADQPGSPLLYGTTDEFLDRFGLGSIEDLPRDGELARD